MSETESQRAARIADKYVAPDGGKPKRPKKGKGAGKPLYSSGEGLKVKELFTPKVRPSPIVPKVIVYYSDELFRTIIQRIATGETVADICEEPGMPYESTFYDWIQKDSKKNEFYARAQWERAHVHLEAMISIADRATPETVSVAKLRIDTRKFTMSMIDPEKYTERRAIEHSGLNPTPKVQLNPRMLSESAREALREECRRILEERDANTIDVTPVEDK